MLWRFLGCVSLVMIVTGMEESEDAAPTGTERFGMLSDIASIPGIQLDKDILMKLQPEVLEQLIRTLEASGLANKAQAYQEPDPIVNEVEEVNTCPDTDANGIAYYCKDMPDGLYHDPWNPWCGYIKCSGGLVNRMNCPRGSWMDIKSTLGMGQKELCQLPLRTTKEEKACHMHSDMYMCKNAERIAKPQAEA